MRNQRIIWLLSVGLGAFLLTGCGGEQKKTYEQANTDLEQGNYDYALNDYQSCISAGYKLSDSYRGSGIVKLRTGDYQGAIDDLTSALNDEETGKSDRKDILEYRATAELKAELYDQAMADCQTLAEDYSLTANDYYLTGCVALAMDSYDEASSNFSKAYGDEATYEMAIQIYEAYLGHDMEADGTKYLEASLKTEAKTAEDYCERGKVYYYMEDYDNARTELSAAADKTVQKLCCFLAWYIWHRETLPVHAAFSSSILRQTVKTRQRDITGWHSVILQTDLMTVHLRISARDWEMRNQMRCRIFSLMKS